MSFYLYDKSVVDRLVKVVGDDRIHIVAPDLAVSFIAQFDKDKVKLPAIVLSRGTSISLSESRNQVVALKGQTSRIDPSDNTAVKARLIPMRVEWSIDVYAVDRYTCDEIVRELIYFFITYPRFEVKIPYDLDIIQNFDILLTGEIEDNSDLIRFPDIGEVYRETFSIYTENAHLYSSKRQYLVKVDPDLDSKSY